MIPATPDNIDPALWHQSIGLARQACARIFRDGGSPAEALAAFGLRSDCDDINWTKAIDRIAEKLCVAPTLRKAA